MFKTRFLSMLVLLMTVATGAWAQATFGVQEITADMVPSTWNNDETMVTPQDMAGLGIDFVEVTQDQAKAWADYPTSGHVVLLHSYSSSFYSVDWEDGNYTGSAANYRRTDIYSYINSLGYKTFITVAPPTVACPAPTNLAVTDGSITARGATITWEGTSDSYVVMIGQENLAVSADFEDQTIPAAFTNTGARPWTVTAGGANGSGYCAIPGNQGVNTSQSDLTLEVTLNNPATVSFNAKVSSENNYDWGLFLIDGTQMMQISGTQDWTAYSYELTAGTHTLIWRYYKDNSDQGGNDLFYVDDIVVSAGVDSWNEYTTTAQTYTFENLTPNRSYQVKVKGNCGDAGYSQESAPVRFTTLESCPMPTGLTASNVTVYEATITWTSAADAWQICVNDDEENLIDVTETTYNFTGLDAETTYTIKVRTNCGDEYSDWATVNFTTDEACPAPSGLTATPYAYSAVLNWQGTSNSYQVAYRTAACMDGVEEGFSADNPTGWLFRTGALNADGTATLSGTSSWTIGTRNNVFDTHIYMNMYSMDMDNPKNYWLITPSLEIKNGDALNFDMAYTSFDDGNPVANGPHKFIVLISTDEMAHWSILREWNNSGSSFVLDDIDPEGENCNIDLSAFAGTNANIAFFGHGETSDYDNNFHFDNVAIGTPVDAGEWQYMTEITETICQLTGLTPGTKYEWKVQGDCGEWGTSEESATMTFITSNNTCPMPTNLSINAALTATTASLRWNSSPDVENFTVRYRTPGYYEGGIVEGFESGSMPEGWTQSGNGTWYVYAGYGYNGIPAHDGTYNARINDCTTGNETFLITPMIDLSGETNPTLSFWYINYDWAGDIDEIHVYYRVNGGEWVELWNTTEDHSEWTESGEIALPNPSANYQIGFKMVDKYGHGVGLDDIVIGNPIFHPAGKWQTASTTETNVTLTDLEPGTAYEAQVKSDCSDPEEWTNNVSFTTAAVPTYTVSLKEGTEDDTNWKGKVGEGEYQELPLTGLEAGTAVSVKYNGTKKVKSVKAVKKAVAPSFTEVTTFSELQTELSAGKNVKLMNDIECTAVISITSNGALTIDGNGKKLSTTSEIRAFSVGSYATVAFKDLTLTGFVSGGGPAINNSGTIVLDGCTISNCHVNNSNGGGAIENKDGKLYAINTTFSGNYSGEIGGAINNYRGSLYMSGCTFTDNYTTNSNAYYGGAIGINGGSEVRLINCIFSGNKYGTTTGTSDIGVYKKPTNYTIAGCTGATIASNNGDITTNTTGTATLDYSDLSNISFTYNADQTDKWTLASMPAYDVELEVEYETALALSETTDNSAALTEWNGYEADVTLTRMLQTGGWNTLALPFSMDIPSGWTVKELSSTSFADGTLTLNFATAESIEAGKPYLVDVGAANVANPTFDGVTIIDGTTTTETTYVNFVPVMKPTTLTGGDRSVLYLGGAKTLYYPSADVTVNGFRAYFQLKEGLTAGDPQNGARAFVLNLGNHETGIQTLAAPATITDGGTYDLSGRRVGSTTRKGVYIRNGQKVVVK